MAKLKLQLVVDDKGTVVMKQFGKKTKQSMKMATDSTDKFRTALSGMIGAAAAFAAVTVGIRKAITAASDLEEVTSKFNVVFQSQIKGAEQWADVLVDSYAMSTREAKEYLSSIQDLLVPMGMFADQAGEMSNEVVKLAADLASFNNLPTSDVMRDIQSALTGSAVTMKKYGVMLSETRVKQQALNMGLVSGKEKLTDVHKAQARMALIFKDSAAAIGDQVRTMGSYANQTKSATAAVEDLAAALGIALLPAATETIGIFAKMTRALTTYIEKLTIASRKTPILMGDIESIRAMLAAEGRGLMGERVTMPMPITTIPPEVAARAAVIPAPIAQPGVIEGIPGREFGMPDIELLEANYRRQQEHNARKLELEEEYWRDVTELQLESQADRDAYFARGEQQEEARVQLGRAAMTQMMGDAAYFFQYMGRKNEAYFRLSKLFSIAQTVMKTIEAAQNAYAWASAWGGPIAGVVAATAAALAGLARVAQISATQPGGGAGGGAAGGGAGTYSVSATTGLPPIRGNGDRGTLTIHIAGDFYGDEAFIDMLADRINAAVEERDVRLVSNESR